MLRRHAEAMLALLDAYESDDRRWRSDASRLMAASRRSSTICAPRSRGQRRPPKAPILSCRWRARRSTSGRPPSISAEGLERCLALRHHVHDGVPPRDAARYWFTVARLGIYSMRRESFEAALRAADLFQRWATTAVATTPWCAPRCKACALPRPRRWDRPLPRRRGWSVPTGRRGSGRNLQFARCWWYARLGRYEEALACAQQQVAINRAGGNLRRRAVRDVQRRRDRAAARAAGGRAGTRTRRHRPARCSRRARRRRGAGICTERDDRADPAQPARRSGRRRTQGAYAAVCRRATNIGCSRRSRCSRRCRGGWPPRRASSAAMTPVHARTGEGRCVRTRRNCAPASTRCWPRPCPRPNSHACGRKAPRCATSRCSGWASAMSKYCKTVVAEMRISRRHMRRAFDAVAMSLLFSIAMCAAAQVPPLLKLPDTVVPVAYDLQLRLDATASTYSGTVSIDVRIAAPTDLVWINATDLKVDDVRAVGVSGNGDVIGADVVAGNKDVIGLRFARPLPAGDVRLALRFAGTFSTTNVAGLFRQKDRDDWYVLTQHEPMYARRAFPCFDEPRFRAAWRIVLTVPEGQRAFSNMPIDAERASAPGWREVSFSKSPPIASYLVAIAVGPWDVLDGGAAGRECDAAALHRAEGSCRRKRPMRRVSPRRSSSGSKRISGSRFRSRSSTASRCRIRGFSSARWRTSDSSPTTSRFCWPRPPRTPRTSGRNMLPLRRTRFRTSGSATW